MKKLVNFESYIYIQPIPFYHRQKENYKTLTVTTDKVVLLLALKLAISVKTLVLSMISLFDLIIDSLQGGFGFSP